MTAASTGIRLASTTLAACLVLATLVGSGVTAFRLPTETPSAVRTASFSKPPNFTAAAGSDRASGTSTAMSAPSSQPWTAGDRLQAEEARSRLGVWPLDKHNAVLLNEVHPRNYTDTDKPHELYDLIAVGAGAGGLVSSKQSARRGAKSAMISEHLAGGDCLNVGCVPSKALIRSAKAVAECRRAAEFGVVLPPGEVKVDFRAVMDRLRNVRAAIAPADGHSGTEKTGAHVFQGRGRFTGPDTLQVNGKQLRFKKCVVATGGRPMIPNVPGLDKAPYTTNEQLFNLEELPPRLIVIGAGVVALEMAQSFALLGSQVTVLNRSSRLFESKGGDREAAELLQSLLEKDGVKFVSNASASMVETVKQAGTAPDDFPVMKVTVGDTTIECECLLVATGRLANVEDLGLDEAGVDYVPGKGMKVNDLAQSVSNPNVYGVGDCVADVPRLTHMSGEMAKLVVQNALAGDDWKLSSLVVPAVAYTHPEYATVGIASEDMAAKQGIDVDVYRTGLEHNDRSITDGFRAGFCKTIVEKGTDKILGATIVAERAGEMINEVSLAMKNGLGLYAIGRNIHAYPTTGECVQFCGVQYINQNLPRLD